MTSNARAQRLVDEFNEAATWGDGFNVARGIAAVLEHLVETEAVYSDDGSFYGIRAGTLTCLVAALTAPTLLERAMAGDAKAARQFLHQAGFTDEYGNWLPQYQSHPTP